MIQYSTFTLENGLKVIVHPSDDTAIVTLNLIYDVGARDEHESKTGFAHLFEHLMFGGSINIPNFDDVLQEAGAENNAFTSNDVTNYYIQVHKNNLETAFWAESDRMLSLSFDPKVLEVQRKVVIEEFKQRYINQPFGDVWLLLRELCYTKHPYKWATIGKEIKHIEEATMEDVKAFFKKHYLPNNATLVVGGPVTEEEIKVLAKKWFEPIHSEKIATRKLPIEPEQTEKRTLIHESTVPVNALFKAYHMCGKMDPKYYAADLLSDILGRDNTSILYKELVEKQKLFTSISAFILGSFDPGLWVINGQLHDGITFEQAEQAIDEVITTFKEKITESDIEKVKNQALSTVLYGQTEVLDRCISLAYASLLGDTELVNKEMNLLDAVTKDEIFAVADEMLVDHKSSVLYYKKGN